MSLLSDMFEIMQPLWFIALIPVFIGIFLKRKGGYMYKESISVSQRGARNLFRTCLPLFFATLTLVFIVLALTDVTRKYSVEEETLSVNRIFVAIDNSSSMYDFSGNTPIYCTDKNLDITFPRIYGACRALYRLIDETQAFSQKKGIGEEDKIAILRFALYSFGQIPPTSDYERLRVTIDKMNWRLRSTLGIFTEIHLALWDMYLMAIERNRVRDGESVYFSKKDIEALYYALAPEEGVETISLPNNFMGSVNKEGEYIPGKIDLLREELKDTVFIIITDAYPGQLDSRLNKEPVSLIKMLSFAKILHLPVYFISTDNPHLVYKRLARETGFGPVGSPNRGDFLVVKKDDSFKRIEELMANILAARFGRKFSTFIERRESYTPLFSILALTFFLFWVLSKETIRRSLTDV